MGAGPIRASTGGRRPKPTPTGCRRLRHPEPGRRSTYQAGEPVQTNRASSEKPAHGGGDVRPAFEAAALDRVVPSGSRPALAGVPKLAGNAIDTRNRVPDTRPGRVHPNGTSPLIGHGR